MPPRETESYLNRLEAAFFVVRRHLAPSSEERRSLTGSQFFLLKLVESAPAGLMASELATRLGVSTSALTGMVDRLVRPGLVERQRDAGDRRVIHICVTEQGRQALGEAQARRRARVREVFSRLGEPELKDLVLALEGAARALGAAGEGAGGRVDRQSSLM